MAAVLEVLLLAALAASCFGEVMARRSEPALLKRLTSGVKESPNWVSALGDPGMRSDRLRVAVEGWDFCNRAGERDFRPSPRWADCADLSCPSSDSGASLCKAINKVSEFDNNLKPGDPFPGDQFISFNDPNLYAVEKGKYLGSLCAVDDAPRTWSFWMIMLKNGNFDENSGRCRVANTSFPVTARRDAREHFPRPSKHAKGLLERKNGFPCFGLDCMNQPILYHNWSQPQFQRRSNVSLDLTAQKPLGVAGGFYGTYDLEAEAVNSGAASFFSINWYKNKSGESWNFHHVLRVNHKYPWLMLYLRADATSGSSGGFPWETRGMMHKVPQSPDFKVMLTLNVLKGGGSQSQFYLMDIGGCWKNDGEQCNGDLATDVTRYSEMIINPDTPAWCRPDTLDLCPPFHTFSNGTKVHRNDTLHYPYSAYHLYCTPYNAKHAEKPFRLCDPYSNPQPQELVQLLPHPEWAVHGYPASKGEGWIGNSRTWELDVGGLSSRLYFYQDPGTQPAIRKWPSIDVGTEIYISDKSEMAEWILSDFEVLIP